MEPPRRSNWQDAANVSLPACPKCGAVNRPNDSDHGVTVVYIEIVGMECFCRVCGKAWTPDGMSCAGYHP